MSNSSITPETPMEQTSETAISANAALALTAVDNPESRFWVPGTALDTSEQRRKFCDYMESLENFFAKSAAMIEWQHLANDRNLTRQEHAAWRAGARLMNAAEASALAIRDMLMV